MVECTALVLAESCSEFDGRITLFGVLDELRPNVDDEEFYFVVYAKSYGIKGARVESADGLVPALEAAFAAPESFEQIERRRYDDTEFVFLRLRA